jgi:predicted DNA-binding ribbon-helix-helix protein
MRSTIAKRSVVIAGHKTSISLEDAFWNDLRRIAAGREMSVSDLVGSIDADRETPTCHLPFVYLCLAYTKIRLPIFR